MNDDKKLPECRYGSKCYRKNADHLKKFRHPPAAEDTGNESSKSSTTGGDSSEGGYESDNEDIPGREDSESDKDKLSKPKRRKIDKDQADGSDGSKSGTDQGENDGKDDDRAKSASPIHLPRQTSYEDRKNLIKQYFLFDMPDDFYALWDLAKSLKPEDPCNAFQPLGLILCGTFDVMSGTFDMEALGADEVLLYWRYYYDVPEFQTVVREVADEKEDSLFHIGYLRDAVQDVGPVVCSNNGKDCKLTIMGDNLYAAMNAFAMSKQPNGEKDAAKLMKALISDAKKHKLSMDLKNSKKVKERNKKVVAKTFHGAGIVVQVENDVGYRSLGITDDQLKKILRPFEDDKKAKEIPETSSTELQQLITYVQFANDECDFGMGYELGIDLFCTGYTTLHAQIEQLLSVAYMLLKREEFKTILSVHLKNRKHGVPSVAPDGN